MLNGSPTNKNVAGFAAGTTPFLHMARQPSVGATPDDTLSDGVDQEMNAKTCLTARISSLARVVAEPR